MDATGTAYVTGYTLDELPDRRAPSRPRIGGGDDAFVTKLNAAGTALVYSTYLGGSGTDVGTGIAVDARGAAYVTGYTASTDFPTASALQADLRRRQRRVRDEAERGGHGARLLHLPRRQRRRRAARDRGRRRGHRLRHRASPSRPTSRRPTPLQAANGGGARTRS